MSREEKITDWSVMRSRLGAGMMGSVIACGEPVYRVGRFELTQAHDDARHGSGTSGRAFCGHT